MPAFTFRLLVALLFMPAVAIATAAWAPPSALARQTSVVAVVLGLAGAALALTVRYTWSRASRDQWWRVTWLARIFDRTLHAVAALLIAHTGLAVAVVLLASGGALPASWFVLPLAVVTVPGLIVLVQAALEPCQRSAQAVVMTGASVSRQDAPALWACVDELAARAAVAVPDHVVLSAEWQFDGIDGVVEVGAHRLCGRALICSLPAADVLDVSEFRALVAGQLARFDSVEADLERRLGRTLCRWWSARFALQPPLGASHQRMKRRLFMPVRVMLEFVFDGLERDLEAIRRDAEFGRDQRAAAVTSARSMGVALARLAGFGPVWIHEHRSLGSEPDDRRVGNRREWFVSRVGEPGAIVEHLGWALGQGPWPFEGNPPLRARLASLGVAVDDVYPLRGIGLPVVPASTLCGDTSAVDEQQFVSVIYC